MIAKRLPRPDYTILRSAADRSEHGQAVGISETLIRVTPVNRSPISLMHSWKVRCPMHPHAHRAARPLARFLPDPSQGPFLCCEYRQAAGAGV